MICIIYKTDTSGGCVRFRPAEYSTVVVELHGDLHNEQILASKDVPDCFGMLSILAVEQDVDR